MMDVRIAWRAITGNPAWTAAAILSVALGIGAATATYSVIDAVIVNQLPYRGGDRVYIVWGVQERGGASFRVPPLLSTINVWRAQSRNTEDLAAFRTTTVRARLADETSELSAASVEPGFATFAGIGVIVGRQFTREEASPGGPHVVQLSERLWRTRFGASTDVLGKTLFINDTAYRIVGVTSDRLRLPIAAQARTELWTPLRVTTDDAVSVLLRSRTGASEESLLAELDMLANRDGRAPVGPSAPWRTELVAPRDELGRLADATYLLGGVVVLLVLIATANLVHLFAVDSAARARELAVRKALGASTRRLWQQELVRGAIVCLAGGALGIGIAAMVLASLPALRPTHLEALDRAQLNPSVLIVAASLSTLAIILTSTAAVMQVTRSDASNALRGGQSTLVSGGREARARTMLVVSEVAVAAVLLVGATVLVRSIARLQEVSPGFDTRQLFSLDPQLPRARYASRAMRTAFYEELLERVTAIPGVVAASAAGRVPPIVSVVAAPIEVEGVENAAANMVFMPTMSVRPDIFSTMQIAFVDGATFSVGADLRNEVIINRALARQLWPQGSPVGRRFRLAAGPGAPWLTVVGVTRDIMTRDLPSVGKDGVVFFPSTVGGVVVFRTNGEPGTLSAVREAVRRIDPQVTAPRLTSFADALRQTTALPRFVMRLVVVCALVAVTMAIIGLYGVIAHGISRRRRELALRIALGAPPHRVASVIIVRALFAVVGGICLGLAGAFWGTRIVQAFLFEISAADPWSYMASAVLLLGVTVVACLPALWRVNAISPARTLSGDR